MITIIYKILRRIWLALLGWYNHLICVCRFIGNGVRYSSFHTGGVPYVMVARGAIGMRIGYNFSMNNGISHNPIGMPQPCTFFVDRGCMLTIGNNVGISQTALIAHADLTIGDNVKIGGGTCIYTSDFHSLDPIIRSSKDDLKNRKCAPVTIENNVFIGARCMILKGVTIGENSIVGAGSVVTKSIPANQVWAGNPAKFIRDI